MKQKRWSLLSLIAVIAIATEAWWLLHSRSGNRGIGWGWHAADSKQSFASVKAAAEHATARIEQIRSQLSASTDSGKNRQLLAELRKLLDQLPPDIASNVVQSFLASGQDANTSLNLTVKAGGGLGDASSLRVFLLDYLGRIDRPAAGKVAMGVLSFYTTPDEWAVSLRNFAWANPNPDGYGYLQAKARQLLENPEWRKNPSVGFLEAFDTIVYAHATDLTPDLAALLRDKDNRASAHAAYLALDRLTLTEPAAMLKQIVTDPDLMKGREQTRADLVARADIRQSDQRALVEKYLLDPGRSQQELTTFAATYPNANYMISDNLLTEVKTPRADDLIVNDREALKVVEEWENDPQFEPILPILDQIRSRLENFVRQADRSR